MKALKQILLLVAITLAFSCEKSLRVGEDGLYHISASTPGQIHTKVDMARSGDNYLVTWIPEDRIAVNGETSISLDIDSEDAAKADFGFENPLTRPLKAVYPASAYVDEGTVRLPATQNYSDDKADPAAALMLGTGTTTLAFSHAMAYIQLQANSTAADVRRVVVRSKGTEPMSGDFTVSYGSSSPLSAKTANGAAVTLDIPSGTAAGSFLIAVPPINYSSGISITVTDMLGGSVTLGSTTGAFSPKAGKVYRTDFEVTPHSTAKTLVLTPIENLNAGTGALLSHAGETSRSSLQKIERTYQNLALGIAVHPTYPRLRKAGDSKWILLWQSNDGIGASVNYSSVYYSLSNNLTDWSEKKILFGTRTVTNGLGGSSAQYGTNPEALLLSDGRLAVVSSFWNNQTYREESCKRKDHGIRIKFSSDGGETWTPEQIIYRGPAWEPYLIELPTGELECYFAESRPWVSDAHSGTSMIVSYNRGASWTPAPSNDPWRVMRSKWWDSDNSVYKYTLQMPSGIRLAGSNKKAFALETVSGKLSAQQHHISVVYSPDNGQWVHLEGDETGPSEGALMSFVEGTGPSLVQFPSGETVLSYENSSSMMEYRMGNASAGGFNSSSPTQIFENSGAWSAMQVMSPHIIAALDRYNSYDPVTGRAALSFVEYALNHSIQASRHTVSLDTSDEEWENLDDALYIGGPAEATIRASVSGDNLCLMAEVWDENLDDSDNLTIYFGSSSAYVRFNADGRIESTFDDARMVTAYDGTIGDDSDTDNGYRTEICIPLASLPLAGTSVALNAQLFDAEGSTTSRIAALGSASTWPLVKGLSASESGTPAENPGIDAIDYDFNWE